MQLGELQNQLARFERRNVSIIALSVDTPAESGAMIDRLGLTFDIGSDPDQTVVKAFRVQNPETNELALHAVYIVDEQGRVFYRKVARRRPTSAELIDAVDAHRGTYPLHDRAAERRPIRVAYPQNVYQALLTISAVDAAPASVDGARLVDVSSLMRRQRSDDAVVAFRRLCASSTGATSDDLLDASAWLVRAVYLESNPEAIAAGIRLRGRLDRIAELEGTLETAPDTDARDETLHVLAGARAGLQTARAEVAKHTSQWRLEHVKAALRSLREVARAARR